MPRQPIACMAALRDRDAVGAERQRLGEVGRRAQPAGDDQRDVAARPRRSRWRRARASAGIVGHRDVVAEEQRRGAGAAAAAVEDDVVDADLERGVDVVLDVLGRQLEADRDAAGRLAHLVGEVAEVARRVVQSGKRAGEIAGSPVGQAAHLGDLARHLVARQVAAGAGLGALAALEVEGLDLLRPCPCAKPKRAEASS